MQLKTQYLCAPEWHLLLISVSIVSALVCINSCCLDQTMAAGVTGLKFSTLKENWGSAYQFTNNAGIPATTGVYWDFEYVDLQT